MGQSHAKKENETRLLSHTLHKNQLKWNKDLNVRPETIKLLEENRGSLLFEISLGNYFLPVSLQEKQTEEKKKANGSTSKEKIFAPQRKLSTKQKGCLLNGRKYFQTEI